MRLIIVIILLSSIMLIALGLLGLVVKNSRQGDLFGPPLPGHARVDQTYSNGEEK